MKLTDEITGKQIVLFITVAIIVVVLLNRNVEGELTNTGVPQAAPKQEYGQFAAGDRITAYGNSCTIAATKQELLEYVNYYSNEAGYNRRGIEAMRKAGRIENLPAGSKGSVMDHSVYGGWVKIRLDSGSVVYAERHYFKKF